MTHTSTTAAQTPPDGESTQPTSGGVARLADRLKRRLAERCMTITLPWDEVARDPAPALSADPLGPGLVVKVRACDPGVVEQIVGDGSRLLRDMLADFVTAGAFDSAWLTEEPETVMADWATVTASFTPGNWNTLAAAVFDFEVGVGAQVLPKGTTLQA